MTAPAESAAVETVDAVVAGGRSVTVNLTPPVTGTDAHGNKLPQNPPVFRSIGPGQTVTLPADEAERLQALGFLAPVEPAAPPAAPKRADATPSIKSKDGPRVERKHAD